MTDKKIKCFVTGVNGQLGYDVMCELVRRGHEAVGSDIAEGYTGFAEELAGKAKYITLDITDDEKVSEVLLAEKPDVVIHCAAWTAVDAAEAPENEAKVRAVNVEGTHNIANACKTIDAAMIYILRIMFSTDRERNPGSRIRRIMRRLMFTADQSWTESWRFHVFYRNIL